jgi:hypothetical protein
VAPDPLSSLFPPSSAGYVQPVVKIKLGARSNDWPRETKTLQSDVVEHFQVPDYEAAFPVPVFWAECTIFLKKSSRLHEVKFRPPDKPPKAPDGSV